MKSNKLPALTCSCKESTLLKPLSHVDLSGGVKKPRYVRWQLPSATQKGFNVIDITGSMIAGSSLKKG